MDESGNHNGAMSLKSHANIGCDIESRDEEDEDEDVDFNPSMKEALSPYASSSLSSEIEERDLEADATEYEIGYLCNETDGAKYTGLDIKGEKASEYQKNEGSFSQPEIENMGDHETGLASGTDVLDYETAEEFGTGEDGRNPVFDFDDDGDAICKRTRARYSLVSFTLDELETFLQETDDDDDLPNVDDEEEYRKFLAAVLLGGGGNEKGDQENQTVDDEDEENDADFELEIEEALESDTDERTDEKEKDEEGRRPETRQNRRKKMEPAKDSGGFQNVQRPLRPIVPLLPSAPISLFSVDRTSTRPCLHSAPENLVISGFTPHQLGQLHCIIYEHIQLLVQVFSLSIFDPARQQIASQVQGLILDFIEKRNQALAVRSEPHPFFCFSPPYVHPSVPCELPKTWPIQFSPGQSPSLDSFGQTVSSHSNSVPLTEEQCNNEVQEDASQKNERAFWLPLIRGPLNSILDATPLNFAGEYIHDVNIAMREYQQRYLRDSCDTQFERESMFPSFLDPNVDCVDATTSRVSPFNDVSSSLPNQKSSKKSFAGELVENSKKQPVALVPRVLSKLAQRFFAIFNPALYPRKPPPVSVANRFLFTTAEDELLALGMMEYNTDWKAIQQRFLPCKSKHQIFVRQKNCCSSKAPDNPIKAVRRMKTSPLTVDEVARIREGLKIYKLDWFSIWKFIVPYRDPSLLARQWRIALGTQKSYKSDSANKERRRQYEANRRRTKAEMAESQILAEKRDNNHSADESIENEDEAFVHEAFIADCRPHTDASVSTQLPVNYQGNIQNGQEAQKVSYYTHAMNLKSPVSGATSKSTFCSRPYRARRTRKAPMVKLAPDLPALNLPPSVRVMSQSAFKSYQHVASVKVPTRGSGCALNVTPPRLSFTGFGASYSNMGMPNQNTSVGKTVTNSRVDNGEADLEMHPLLFQSSGDGSGLPYHPLKFTPGTSSSFSFFNGNQQTGGGLFRKEQDSATGSLYSELKALETTSAPCGIDFHPLLRRTDEAACSSRKALSSVQPSVSLELMNETEAGSNSGLHEKASELNLEIQLSSSPKGQRFRMVKEGTGYTRSVVESKITSKDARNLPSRLDGNNPLSFFLDSNPNPYTYRADLAGEQSLDIVMEREELSDSDEEDNEIEENVEFEREEMTDSEPDVESDFEAAVLTQKKEVNSERNNFTITAEEQATVNGSDFHPCLTLNLAYQDQDSQMSNGKYQTKEHSVPLQSNKPSRKRTPVRKRTRGAAKTPSSVPLALGSSIETQPKKPRKRVCKSKLGSDTSPTGGSESVNTDKQT